MQPQTHRRGPAYGAPAPGGPMTDGDLARAQLGHAVASRPRRRVHTGAVVGGAGAAVLGLIYFLLRVARVLGREGESGLALLVFLGLMVACVIGGVAAVIIQGSRRRRRVRALRAAQFARSQYGPSPVALPSVQDEADALANLANAAEGQRRPRGPLRT